MVRGLAIFSPLALSREFVEGSAVIVLKAQSWEEISGMRLDQLVNSKH